MHEHDELEEAWLEGLAETWRSPEHELEEDPARWEELASELSRRHRGEQRDRIMGLIALGVGAVLVIAVAWYRIMAGGPLLIPLLGLLYLPAALGMGMYTERLWREKQRIVAQPPREALAAIGAYLDVRQREQRWSQRMLPAALFGALGLGVATLITAPGISVMIALGVVCAVFAGAGYFIYVRNPRELRAERARCEALQRELDSLM